jgi:uncharacterized coiled-coil protein SlyX
MNGDNHTIDNKLNELEKKYAVIEERIANHVTGTKENVEKAEQRMDKRLDSMNEFRDTLKDQAKEFVTLAYLNVVIEKLNTKLESQQKFIYLLSGGLILISILIPVVMKFI